MFEPPAARSLSAVTACSTNNGILLDLAAQFNALVVFAEHRYYGKDAESSMPFGKRSFAVCRNI